MGQYVFIAHKHNDKGLAAHLIRQVQPAGSTVWVDSEQPRAGQSWRWAISWAVHDAFALVVATPEAKALSCAACGRHPAGKG